MGFSLWRSLTFTGDQDIGERGFDRIAKLSLLSIEFSKPFSNWGVLIAFSEFAIAQNHHDEISGDR